MEKLLSDLDSSLDYLTAMLDKLEDDINQLIKECERLISPHD